MGKKRSFGVAVCAPRAWGREGSLRNRPSEKPVVQLASYGKQLLEGGTP